MPDERTPRVMITKHLLNEKQAYGSKFERSLNMKYGGQFGYAPEYSEWISNKSYVKRNLIINLLESPKFFEILDEPKIWREALKAFVELHPKSVEGFQRGLEVTLAETEFGAAGEMQEEYTDVKRARTTPTFKLMEKEGNIIQRFLEFWIRFGLMDPDTKTPMATTLPNYEGISGNANRTDWLSDWYTMSFIAYEPTPTMKHVNAAYICTNCFPTTTGEITHARNTTVEGETVELDIPFTSITDSSDCAKRVAESLLEQLKLENADPQTRIAFLTEANPNIADLDDVGYEDSVESTTEKCEGEEQAVPALI